MAESELKIVLVDDGAAESAAPVAGGAAGESLPAGPPRVSTARTPDTPAGAPGPAPRGESPAPPRADEPPRERQGQGVRKEVGAAAKSLAGLAGLDGALRSLSGVANDFVTISRGVTAGLESLAAPKVTMESAAEPFPRTPTRAAEPDTAGPPARSAALPDHAEPPAAGPAPVPVPPKRPTGPDAVTVARAGGASTTEAKAAPAGAPRVTTAGPAAAAAGSGLAAGATVAGVAVAGLAVAAAGTALAVKKLTDVFHDQAGKLENYSVELGIAAGQNQFREEMASLRRAQAIGPQLARFENFRGRVNEAISDLGTKILEILLKMFDKFEPVIIRIPLGIDVITATLEKTVAQVESFIASWTRDKADDVAAAARLSAATIALSKAIKDFVEGVKKDEDTDVDPFFLDFLDSGVRAGLAPHPAVALPVAGGLLP